MTGRRDSLWGRRKGKPLSARRADLMERRFPALAVDIESAAPDALASLFPLAVSEIYVEIGFGGGEHLIHEAEAIPGVGFIGIEPFLNGMAKALAAIVDRGLENIRLFNGDAALLLDWLPAGSVRRVDLLYPDPWPKTRHWKRRFVNTENLDRVTAALASGGEFRFVSDIDSYVAWTLSHCLMRSDLSWTARRADDWRRPFPGWPGTRYEAKARAAGRSPTYLAFRRN